MEEMKHHEANVRTWRKLLESIKTAARHDPSNTATLFYDDTGAMMLPHVTNRPLKDLPTARVMITPWIIQDSARGEDHYVYMLKGAFKKGGNRICTQLYHQLRAIKTGAHDVRKAKDLHLIGDNYAENKNNLLFAFLSDVIKHGWFQNIWLLFGEVGHTHCGDDAQHHIHNVVVGQYFNPTLVHWINNYPLAWRQERSRPFPVLLDTLYDFETYYSGCINKVGGFTTTQKDDAMVRGFHFAKGASGTIEMKISMNPGDGKPYLGVDNTPASPGYVVLAKPVRADVKLAPVPPCTDFMDAKYLRQVLGKRMQKTMEVEGMGEALGWLKEAATTGRIPVERVLEETTPDGKLGRLVELKCGDVTATARQIVAPLYDLTAPVIWGLPGAMAVDVVASEREEPLPCMGYANVAAHRRPTYQGSRRQALSKKADAGYASGSDAGEDEVLQPAGEEKQQATKARKANNQAESVLRHVRATAGKDANGKAELWWYVPENASDQSNKRRRGWWLYELSASGKEGC